MAVGAFPIAKLAYLAVKQISKPIANQIKNGAKRSRIFRTYVCLPPAQFYHWVDTRLKFFLMGLGKPVNVAPLNEQVAVDLGAELLGESIVFVMAAATVFLEYDRQNRNSQNKEDKLTLRLDSMQGQINELSKRCDQQDEQIQQLLLNTKKLSPPQAPSQTIGKDTKSGEIVQKNDGKT